MLDKHGVAVSGTKATLDAGRVKGAGVNGGGHLHQRPRQWAPQTMLTQLSQDGGTMAQAIVLQSTGI